MGKLITLKRDFMFATIFNKEENVSKLERFIAIYFGYTYEQVHNNLKLVKRDLPKDVYTEAKKQVDLVLILNNMELNINIEIDSDKPQRIKDRNTKYLTKIDAQLGTKSGNGYDKIYETRQIAFNVNNKENNKELFIDEQRLMSVNTNKIFSNKIGIDEINMSLIDKLDYNSLEEKEKICYNFIKMLLCEEKDEFEKVSEKLMSKNESKELAKQVSDLSQDVKYIEMAAAYRSDKEMYEDLLREEKEREFNKGVSKGISKGIEQGTLQNKIDTAKKMLSKHMSLEDISEITELSIDEIKKL